ncbi:hypothetical protein BV898_01376 [Hypsibius exemplaris]|uniref:Spaetzle domain-containing protein n=1 Tax=Hypsibius exemplaris TaxID=2072580 RepID=A0A1W0XBA2_HYPEX|nr:hypothetical protein BV898_01376 [Hypsibius exemplaris]
MKYHCQLLVFVLDISIIFYRTIFATNSNQTDKDAQNLSRDTLVTTSTANPSVAPAKLLFRGYQHNYYTYDEPLTPYAKVRPLLGHGFLSDTLAKLDPSFRTAKKAKAKRRQQQATFSGFEKYPAVVFSSSGVGTLDRMDVAASDAKLQRHLLAAQINETVGGRVGPGTKLDSVYGITMGSSYTPACVKSPLQTICLDDPFYPTDSVKEAVLQSRQDFMKLYADVAFQSADNLCDGITRQDEEKHCNVFSQIHPISSSSSWTANYAHKQGPQGGSMDLRSRSAAATTTQPPTNSPPFHGQGKGYICQSVIHYARVLRAKNHRGQWRIVVNVPGYTQTSRFEECLRPLHRCQYISSKLQTSCIQKWNFHRLMVWDKYNGFETDIFRLPIACSCFIRPKAYQVTGRFYGERGFGPDTSRQSVDLRKAPRTVPLQKKELLAPPMQISETSKRYSYMPPDGSPVDPYLYYYYLSNLLPDQSVKYVAPGTVQVGSTEYVYGNNGVTQKKSL